MLATRGKIDGDTVFWFFILANRAERRVLFAVTAWVQIEIVRMHVRIIAHEDSANLKAFQPDGA